MTWQEVQVEERDRNQANKKTLTRQRLHQNNQKHLNTDWKILLPIKQFLLLISDSIDFKSTKSNKECNIKAVCDRQKELLKRNTMISCRMPLTNLTLIHNHSSWQGDLEQLKRKPIEGKEYEQPWQRFRGMQIRLTIRYVVL